MVAVFDTAIHFVRHMAIGTRQTTLCVRSEIENFKIRMLCFQHWRTAEFMYPVHMLHFIVVFFNIFYCHPFIPGERQIFAIAFEIIFHMALGASQRTHFLCCCIFNVFSLTFEGFNKSGARNIKLHGFVVVTIGATNGIYNFLAQCRPFALIEFGNTHFVHHAWHIRTFTGPAGGRLHIVFGFFGRASTQSVTHIGYGMTVSAWRFVVHGKCVTGPKYYHFGTIFEHILACVA